MTDRIDEGTKRRVNSEEEHSEFSLFRRLFRLHPDDGKAAGIDENSNNGSFLEGSPGSEKFFRKLFRDRDRSVEDSELFGSKKQKEVSIIINFNFFCY